MSLPIRPPLSAADYDAIETAMLETSRGRWFLAEFARRHRHADTTMLLSALERLENVVRESSVAKPAVAAETTAASRETTGQGRDDAAATPLEAPERAAPAAKRKCDPLAPLAAMSYEEKTALFT